MPFTSFVASPAIYLDPYTTQAAKAIAMTKEFISARGLVCYGGTALDYAARLEGGKIYDDEKLALPDLDFYSVDPLRDARDLADILWAAGFEETRVINALHVGTFRVDCGSNHFVADVGYCPILNDLKTLTYESFKIVHPDYQRLDMHSALSFIYDNPPREVVFARINKDIERFNIINALYPIPAIETATIPVQGVVRSDLSKTLVYAGVTAYQIHMNLPISVAVLEVVSHSPKTTVTENGWTVIAEFYPLINILPAMTFATSAKGEKFIIYDTSHRLLSIDSYEHTRVTCKNHCMKMLLGWHLAPRKTIYPFMPSSSESWLEMYSTLLPRMTLSAKYYGDENVDHNSIIKAAEYDRLVLGIPPSPEYVLPMNYRPKNRRRDGEPFNYTGNIFFRVDGSKK